MLPISAKYLCALFEKIYDEADYYRHLKYRGGCTIPSFQLSVWCEKSVAARHYAVIWKQVLFANMRNRVRWVVLGLSQYGACTDFSEYFSEDSWKGDLSNDNIVSPPLFSLVNTFNKQFPADFFPIPKMQKMKFFCQASCRLCTVYIHFYPSRMHVNTQMQQAL